MRRSARPFLPSHAGHLGTPRVLAPVLPGGMLPVPGFFLVLNI